MTPLGREIAAIVESEGPMRLDRFMALALGHPVYGYYRTRDPLGRDGDFITAPEISQMFGELIGLWAAERWLAAGKPAGVRLVELGPGRGTLMADALRAIGKVVPGLRQSARVHLVETSPALRARQGTRVPEAVWHDDFADVPDGPILLVANEFFDALPIRQFRRREAGWCERVVGVEDGRLVFGETAGTAVPADLGAASPGTIIERCEAGEALMARIAARLARDGVAAAVIDYGHLGAGAGDTLQAVRRHRPVDPLTDVGEADLTAHVDFGRLATIALQAGARLSALTTQADFLDALGLRERARRLDQTEAAARLTDRAPRGMGALFKVMTLDGGVR